MSPNDSKTVISAKKFTTTSVIEEGTVRMKPSMCSQRQGIDLFPSL